MKPTWQDLVCIQVSDLDASEYVSRQTNHSSDLANLHTSSERENQTQYLTY